MWIFLAESFLSIVDPRGAYAGGTGPKGKQLLVRARIKGDIERVFPKAKVSETPDRDYRYRALVDRGEVAAAIHAQVMQLDCLNFKASVAEKWRHDAYLKVWSAMEAEQRRQAYGKPVRRRKGPVTPRGDELPF